MKIQGPKGPRPADPPAEPAAEAKRPNGPRFGEILGPDGGTSAPSVSPSLLSEIGAKLEAGEVTGAEAVQHLLEEVVRNKLGHATPEIQERLRAALRQLLEEDPLLAQKIKLLSGDDG